MKAMAAANAADVERVAVTWHARAVAVHWGSRFMLFRPCMTILELI